MSLEAFIKSHANAMAAMVDVVTLQAMSTSSALTPYRIRTVRVESLPWPIIRIGNIYFDISRYGIAFEAKFAYGLQYNLVSLGTTQDEAISNLKHHLKENFLSLRKNRHNLSSENVHKLQLLSEYIDVRQTLW